MIHLRKYSFAESNPRELLVQNVEEILSVIGWRSLYKILPTF